MFSVRGFSKDLFLTGHMGKITGMSLPMSKSIRMYDISMRGVSF